MSDRRQADVWRDARESMVEQQLRARGIASHAVLNAMRSVPRHLFVDPSSVAEAYGDFPLPIGYEQTISQPYMVGCMVELCELARGKKVLEVGAGSGYQTAVLAQLSEHVYATEIIKPLVHRAAAALKALKITHAIVQHCDGSWGWPEHAPYDAIVVAAGAPQVPTPLLKQLSPNGGRLVIPVGPTRGAQVLQTHVRQGDDITCETHMACRFVDLQGYYGWKY